MGIFDTIGAWLNPISKTVDNLHTSKEEKMQLQNQLAEIQAQANAKFLELELAALEARKEVMIAESQSNSWLQANWRPIASLTLLGLVVMQCLANWIWDIPMSSPLFTLATGFLGIYAGGRSVEKTARVNKLGK